MCFLLIFHCAKSLNTTSYSYARFSSFSLQKCCCCWQLIHKTHHFLCAREFFQERPSKLWVFAAATKTGLMNVTYDESQQQIANKIKEVSFSMKMPEITTLAALKKKKELFTDWIFEIAEIASVKCEKRQSAWTVKKIKFFINTTEISFWALILCHMSYLSW